MSSAASRRRRRGARDAAPRWPMPTSARRHRLHQPARHRDAEQRRGRGPRGRAACSGARRRAARPRARPATRSARPASSKRRSACWRGRRAAAGGPARAAARPGARSELPAPRPARAAAAVLSNSFGFGGTNASLILGRADERRATGAPGGGDRGIGLLAPGLSSWPVAARGAARRGHVRAGGHGAAAARPPAAGRTSPRGGRRSASRWRWPTRRSGAAIDPQRLATVFTSSGGEGSNCHALCETLAGAGRGCCRRPASRTRCTTPRPGYWHIAVGSRSASTSLSAYDGSFGAGLLEAATQVLATGSEVLLVALDVPYPEPLHRLRPLPDASGIALVLAPRRRARRARAGRDRPRRLHAGRRAQALCRTRARDTAESGARGAALPLLEALARRWIGQAVVLGYLPTLACTRGPPAGMS